MPHPRTCLIRIFQTPLGLTDAGGWFDGVHDSHFLLTYTLVTPEGVSLRQEELFESGLMNQRALEQEMSRRPGYRIVKNTTAQICKMADFMYEYSSGVDGWRDPPRAPAVAPDNLFVWPMPGQVKARFVDI